MSHLFLTGCLFATLVSCAQSMSGRLVLGKPEAEKQLKDALSSEPHHNVVNGEVLIKDSVTAIAMAEPLLFNIYGKANIMRERPYEAYLADKYWVIMGTLPKETKGGAFLIVMDARDGKIIRITHWK